MIMNMNDLNTFLFAFFLVFLIILATYVISLLIELRRTFKITNTILGKVESELDPLLVTLNSTNEVAQGLMHRIKMILDFIDAVGGVVSSTKDQIINKVKPTRKDLVGFLTGIKKGLQVIAKNSGKKKAGGKKNG